MTVCLICEGSYPYILGGVSGWVQMLIRENPQLDFVIWSIATSREEMHEYQYEIPSNVKEIRTFYLADRKFEKSKRPVRLTAKEKASLRSLVLDEADRIDWEPVMVFLEKYGARLGDILMGKDFYHAVVELYNRKYTRVVFSQFLWNMRSMYFPLVCVLSGGMPSVDLYHAVSTGYAGLLGAVASHVTKCPFLLTEHGIYTREREEEIIRSDWVIGSYKQLWINFFLKLSRIAYLQADRVVTLFEVNRQLQIELGCPPQKTGIIVNGVDTARFSNLPARSKEDDRYFTVGAVVRVVPIKDIKTMLLAFDRVKSKRPDARLMLVGPFDEDRAYYEECRMLADELGTGDVVFTGRADVTVYLPLFDVMMLTSISEGQPLSVLEGMAAGVAQVCTNVGACRELLDGREGDPYGPAGLIAPVMDPKAISDAVLTLAENEALRKQMGENGRKRAKTYYEKKDFLTAYQKLYQELGGNTHGGNRV